MTLVVYDKNGKVLYVFKRLMPELTFKEDSK